MSCCWDLEANIRSFANGVCELLATGPSFRPFFGGPELTHCVSPRCLRTYIGSPVPASWVLELQVQATTHSSFLCFLPSLRCDCDYCFYFFWGVLIGRKQTVCVSETDHHVQQDWGHEGNVLEAETYLLPLSSKSHPGCL